MKAWIPLTMIFALASGAYAQDACTHPNSPASPPDGSTATKDEMIAGSKIVKAYKEEMEKRKAEDGSTSYRVKIRLRGHAPESATFERLTDAKKWDKNDSLLRVHFNASFRMDFIARRIEPK